MPIKITPGTNPLAYLGRREDGWRLQRVEAQDGLNPTQITRYFEAPEGIDFAEATALPFKLDATANADDGSNAANVTTDEHRYVVNPQVLKHQFGGLWTGGPVRWGTDQQTQKRTVEQTLTRTWPAGHGYTLDAAGNYVYSEAAGSLEYATAKQALMAHRPALASRFSAYMAFREDIPGTYWRELTWRDFTHESIPFLEALKDSPEDVAEIVAHHFGTRVAGSVEDLTANIDKDTNTVFVKCSLRMRDLPAAPESVEDLLALPHVEAPCTRETLRSFGLGALAEGEGYRFTHAYRWPGLKDDEATRAFLEWLDDKALLPLLRAADYEADHPRFVATADGIGRYYTVQEQAPGDPAADPPVPATTCRVPWWRIVTQRVEEDRAEDGTLAFTVVIQRPEWHGGSAGTAPEALAQGSPGGWGASEAGVVPSVPQDDAARVMGEAAAAAPAGGMRVTGVERTVGEDGRSDVTVRKGRAWTWAGGDKPPATIALDGVEATDVRHVTTARRAEWDVAFEQLDGAAVQDLIAAVTTQLASAQGSVTVKGVTQDRDGFYRLAMHAEGVQMREFAEWLQTGDFFQDVYRRLRFNVPTASLTPGGLNETTHDIVTADRSLNDDGTWDETVTRRGPSAERVLSYKAKGRPHGAPLDHSVGRNATALPAALAAGTAGGSASYNEFGLIDWQTRAEEDDDSGASAAEDHFTATEGETAVGAASRISEAGITSAGVITSVQETEFPDGKFRSSVTTETPKECKDVAWTTREGDRHHPRDVTHKVWRNASAADPLLTTAQTGDTRVSGSDQHNRFGLHDGQLSTYSAANEDDSGTRDTADHYTATSGNVSVMAASRAAQAGISASGVITSVDETTYPDGKIRSSLTTETPSGDSWAWSDQQAQGRKTRTVAHTVYRNQPRGTPIDAFVGALGTDQVDVSISVNRHGLVDATVTRAPAWSKVSVAAAETFTEETGDITVSEIEKTYRRPPAAAPNPVEGYWWRTVVYVYRMGRTSAGAAEAGRKIENGKPGSKIWPERQNSVDQIGSVWAWKKIVSITPDPTGWKAGALSV